MARVTVKDILEDKEFDLALKVIAGHSELDKIIKIPYVQKPGLAMTGYTDFLVQHRIQVFGKTEITYLRQLDIAIQDTILGTFFDKKLACCVITRGLEPPASFIHHANRTNTPLLSCSLSTQVFIERITRFLEYRFAQTTNMHGVLVDVYGIGILILGKSGIGKSECALDLVLRGHRLVADDIIELFRIPPNIIQGQGSDIIKYHMEIRGLGIINIKELFGISAIRDRKRVHIVVKLVEWDESLEYDRIGLQETSYTILGVDTPLIVLPVRPGRNMTSILEVAARNHLLKLEGYHAAKEFQKRIMERVPPPADLADKLEESE